MPFNIQIAIDPGNSRAGIDGLTGALDKLEAAGPKAAASASAGLKEIAPAAQGAARGVAALTDEEKKFEQVLLVANAQLAQEKTALEAIVGPGQKHAQMIETIERLYAKGKISVDEMTDALTRNNQALARSQPRSGAGFDSTAGEQFGPQFDPRQAGGGGGTGGEGGGVGGLAGMMGIGLSIGAVVGLTKSLFEANDAYQQLENSVRKFADASGGVNTTMTMSRDLAVAMHASMGETIALYDRVTQSTRNLYLTQVQQRDITEGLGIQAKLANVSLDEAASIMKKFTIAADTGTFSMRMFRELGMNMPQMLKALADHFHLSVKAFEDMAVKGHISAREIAIAMADTNNAAAKDKLEEHTRTATDEVQKLVFMLVDAGAHRQKYFEDGVRGGAEAVKSQDAQIAKAQEHIAQVRIVNDVFAILNDGLALTKRLQDELFSNALNDRLKTFNNNILGANAKLGLLNQEKMSFALLDAFGAVPAGAKDAVYEDQAKAANEAVVANNGLGESVLRVIQAETDHETSIRRLTAGVNNANIVGKQHQELVTALAAEYKKAEKALNGVRSELEKLIERLVKQAEAFDKSIVALDFAKPRLSLQLYNEELERLIKNHHDADFGKLFGGLSLDLSKQTARDINNPAPVGGALVDLADQFSPLQSKSKSPLGAPDAKSDSFMFGDSSDTGMAQQSLDAATASYKAARTAVQAYEDAVFDIKLSSGTVEEHAAELKKLRDSLNDMKTPQEVFAQGVKDANDKLNAGVYTLDAYAKKMHDLREAAGTGTFGDGFRDFTDNLKKQGEDSKTSLDLMNAGFTSVNTGIMDLIESKGSLADWGASFLSTMAKVAEQALATKLMLSLIGLGGGGGGVDIAGISAGVMGALIPGHASGAYYPPGGGGGTDSQFVAFRKSPDEDVLVRTPAQRQAMQQGSGGSVTNEYHYYDHGDSRALAPLQQEMRDLRAMIDRSRRGRS